MILVSFFFHLFCFLSICNAFRFSVVLVGVFVWCHSNNLLVLSIFMLTVGVRYNVIGLSMSKEKCGFIVFVLFRKIYYKLYILYSQGFLTCFILTKKDSEKGNQKLRRKKQKQTTETTSWHVSIWRPKRIRTGRCKWSVCRVLQ